MEFRIDEIIFECLKVKLLIINTESTQNIRHPDIYLELIIWNLELMVLSLNVLGINYDIKKIQKDVKRKNYWHHKYFE